MMDFIERVRSRCKIDKNTGCWNYQGRIDSNSGYARISYRGKNYNGHRAVLIHATGVAPNKDVHACHSCDNRRCVNPKHLWWGTKLENMRDMSVKRRSALTQHPEITRGERHPNALLTEKDVKNIRALCRSGETQRKIAKSFNVSQVTVSDINTGKRWGHLS